MLFLYLVGVLAVCVIFTARIKNSDDMFVAGGESPWWVSGLSSYMTMFSSGTFVVWGGIAYKWGLVGAAICAGNGLGALLAGRFVAERWKRTGVTTAAEYFELRFGRAAIRFYTLFNLLYKMIVISVGLYSVAVLLCALIPLPDGAPFRDSETGHLSVQWAIVWFGAIVVAYTMAGGLWAVLMTDVLQFFVLTICVVLVVPLCFIEVGGIGGFMKAAPPGFFSPIASDLTWMFLAGWTIIQFASIGGEWAFAQRFLCVPEPRDARRSAYLFGILYVGTALLWMLPPMLYRVIDSNASPEQAYILACQAVLPAGMIGLMIAAMFSATASMVDSQLNVFSGVLTRDFYAKMFPRRATDKHLLMVGRITVIILGMILICGGLAVPAIGGAEQAALSIASLLIGPLMLPTIWGLFSRRIGKRAVWLSVVLGFTCSAIIKFGFADGGWFSSDDGANQIVAWVQANMRAVEAVAAVLIPTLVLLLEELRSQPINEGWLRVEATMEKQREHPISRASTLPAKVSAWSLVVLGLMMTIICISADQQRLVLAGFTIVLFAAAGAILWSTRSVAEPE
jgi:SSS family transporter